MNAGVTNSLATSRDVSTQLLQLHSGNNTKKFGFVLQIEIYYAES